MALPEVSAGVAFFRKSGLRVSLAEDAPKIDAQRFTQEVLTGADGSQVVKKTWVAPKISGVLRYVKGLDLAKLYATKGETVSLQLATGELFTLVGATFTGTSQFDVMDGKIPFEFTGSEMTQTGG